MIGSVWSMSSIFSNRKLEKILGFDTRNWVLGSEGFVVNYVFLGGVGGVRGWVGVFAV